MIQTLFWLALICTGITLPFVALYWTISDLLGHK